ncbi:hypothetical protein TIFTF001_032764 [Ficus carica]|uniref:Uncharacterized protein n=1 Tax=Ficus carica TaxID=3494 RepID=A0AA88DXS3_FICCA|nr:hypothetical protein TIFTF001_032764 [Ficus carica]
MLGDEFWPFRMEYSQLNNLQNQHFGRKIPKSVSYLSNLPACRVWVPAVGGVGGEGRVGAWAEWGRGQSGGGVGEWGCGQSGGGVGGVGGDRKREKWRKGGVGVVGEREREKWRAWAWREEAVREKLGGGSFEGEIGRRKLGGSFCRF